MNGLKLWLCTEDTSWDINEIYPFARGGEGDIFSIELLFLTDFSGQLNLPRRRGSQDNEDLKIYLE